VTAEQKPALPELFSVELRYARHPCFTGTRVPVQTLLNYIEEGDTLDNFLRTFPPSRGKQAIQFLELAKANSSSAILLDDALTPRLRQAFPDHEVADRRPKPNGARSRTPSWSPKPRAGATF